MPALLLLFLLLLPAGTAFGENLKLSLKECIHMALDKNNRIKEASFGNLAASQAVPIASAGYYPRLFFEESLTASNSPTQTFMMKLDEGRFSQDDFRIERLNNPDARHDFRTAVTAQIPLYIPSMAPARQMAEKQADKSGVALESARQDVAFEVFRLYLEALKAAAELEAAEKSLGEARESRRLAMVRHEAGTGLKSDELRARTQLSWAEQQQITAHNNLIISQMRLAMAAGLVIGSRIEPSGWPEQLRVGGNLDELTRQALARRTDLRALQADLAGSDAAMSLARSAYLPELAGFASYQLNSRDVPFGSDNDAWTAGVSLKWQIFDGFRRCRERDRASAQRSAAAERLEYGNRQAALQLQESLLRREEQGKRLEVARHALLDAEETVRLLARRYENSLATMLELLDAQTALSHARGDLASAEAGYSLAGGHIYNVAGVFLEEMLK